MSQIKAEKKLLRRASLLVLVLVLMFSAVACAAKNEAVEEPGAAAVENGEPEVTLPPVEISMPEYELSYSGELKDVIKVRDTETEVGPGLEFYVELSGVDTTIFVLHYGSEEGELLTFLTDAAGERIPVAFEMAEVPEGLSDEDADVFYTAQEAVNEIVSSLKLK